MKTNFAEEFEQKYVGKYLKYFVPKDDDKFIEVNEQYVKHIDMEFKTKIDKIESMGLGDFEMRISVENLHKYIFVSFNEDFEIFDANPNEILNK